jgi:preprotein translocase subunit SecG
LNFPRLTTHFLEFLMNVLLTLLLAVQMLSALGMIGLILIQHGKGADMGAAFGSGGSGSLFGASGSANFLSHTTAALAGLFFLSTLLLVYFGNVRPVSGGSVLERAAVTAPAPVPVNPGAPGQIPGSAPAAAVVVPPASTTPASGAAQIPGK